VPAPRRARSAPFHVCFVCSGNICRSPYAEALLRDTADRHGLSARIRASSLGTFGIEGQPAHPWTVRVAAERGMDLAGFRSRGVDVERLGEVDLVVALAQDHVAELRARFPEAPPVWLITAPGLPSPPPGIDGVPDPVGFEEVDYRKSLREIESALPPLWAAIRALCEPGGGGVAP
jgi:protein-tyrosine phosphatase